MLCEEIPAALAAEWGLVNYVVPRAELDAKVDEVVEKLAAKLPQTMRYTKQQLNWWRDISWHETIGHARDWLSLSMLGRRGEGGDPGISGQEELVLVERDGRVGVVLMNRPKQLNALSGELMGAVVAALQELDDDPEIRAIVLGGGERAFAAGADIAELAAGTPISLYENRRIDAWDTIRDLRTPVVAAVSGFCLGGGCELAMLCDLIVASETAKFGQPEINLGVLPGAGGTQRLTRAVGKAIAMDMILTGRMLGAREALDARARRARRREGGVARRGEARRGARSPRRARSPCGSRRRRSTRRSRRRSPSASSSSGARSISRARPRTRPRG